MTVQHAQIPQILTEKKLPKKKDADEAPILNQGDKVVYGVIRMHMDEDRTCYPSIATIKKDAHCGQKFVTEAIERLVNAGFIQVGKKKLDNGKWSNLYRFPITEFDKKFDMFTIDFLKLNLPIHLKEYLMDLQPNMYEKESGHGKISYAEETISNKTGWTPAQIKKFDNTLLNLGWLEMIPSGKIDKAGFPIMIRDYDLEPIKQAKLWIKAVNEQLINTQNQLEEIDDKVEQNQEQTKAIAKELNIVKRKLDSYEKALIAHGIKPEQLVNDFDF